MKNQHDELRIIVIDDNPEIHKDFIKILTTFAGKKKQLGNVEKIIFEDTAELISLPKFHIDTASQGKDGVNMIAESVKQGRPYALAFVDIRMPPGWDGVETIKHIWEIDKDVQIVICTAYSDYSWESTIDQLGQRDNLLILKKPFDTIAVQQLACALTQKWRLLQETREHTSSLEGRIQERTMDLQYQATHDSLTGLPNRVLLRDRMTNLIERSNRDNKKFAVFFLDLDRFKLINDSLSHEAGDNVLREVTRRIRSAIRKEDTLARIGGDEFVILIGNIHDKNYLIAFSNKVLSVFDNPFILNEHEIMLTTSIGISIYPDDNTSIDGLLKNADAAMYFAKEKGRNLSEFYTDDLNKKNIDYLMRESELRQAIINNEFCLFYQPQFDLDTEELVSVEALARWMHPKKGLILPMDFIPLAEESGLIVAIGEWVLNTACKQAKAWHDAGFYPTRIAINVTTKQFRMTNLVKSVKTALEESKLNPKYLELELTENMLINDIQIVKTIHELKTLGIQIALDDFGTGFSNLSYLREIPIDRIKIDQSYVQNIDSGRGDDVIIQAIIAMAKNLNLEVLAEGVETQNQIDFLKRAKCGGVQGFYFSRPLSTMACEALLKIGDKIKLKDVIETIE
jgi:diguanylate cyclase (GGDEF)-like protein